VTHAVDDDDAEALDPPHPTDAWDQDDDLVPIVVDAGSEGSVRIVLDLPSGPDVAARASEPMITLPEGASDAPAAVQPATAAASSPEPSPSGPPSSPSPSSPSPSSHAPSSHSRSTSPTTNPRPRSSGPPPIVPPREHDGIALVTPLAPADAAIYETFVQPRYLRHFADLLLDLLSPPSVAGEAIVAHIGCRTGYPERPIVDRLGPVRLVGTDPSPAALELARAKAAAIAELSADYRLFEGFPSPLPDDSFTHAVIVHPPTRAAQRAAFVADAARVLSPGGQLVIALPLRGSFAELSDLLREFATKYDGRALHESIDAAAASRPTPEALADELEAQGFVDVDVEFQSVSIPFQGGRDFLEDPTTRLILVPELQSALGLDDIAMRTALGYVRDAIDKYWAEGGFELGLLVGAARGYRG
jgi:SAM-dependent methyltransferase